MLQNSTLRKLSFLLITLLFITNFLPAEKIITVAGNGNGPGYSKKHNGNPQSYEIAVDNNANIFFSEINKSTVTEIDDEVVSLVTGSISEPGFEGDLHPVFIFVRFADGEIKKVIISKN